MGAAHPLLSRQAVKTWRQSTAQSDRHPRGGRGERGVARAACHDSPSTRRTGL